MRPLLRGNPVYAVSRTRHECFLFVQTYGVTLMAALLCRLGLMEYQPAYQLQTRLVDYRRHVAGAEDIILVVEHPPVYTLGRRGGREHLTVSEDFLTQRGISLVPIERGGVITYHGPGQLVIYPIVHLKEAGLSVADYVFCLEELMICLAAEAGVTALRDERNHGVWASGKKLGSVGIAIRHGVSFHGLALNVNPSMEPFSWINPCGLTGVGMTSLSAERNNDISITDICTNLPDHLRKYFGRSLREINRNELPESEEVR